MVDLSVRRALKILLVSTLLLCAVGWRHGASADDRTKALENAADRAGTVLGRTLGVDSKISRQMLTDFLDNLPVKQSDSLAQEVLGTVDDIELVVLLKKRAPTVCQALVFLAREGRAKDFLVEIAQKQMMYFEVYGQYVSTSAGSSGFTDSDFRPTASGKNAGKWSIDCDGDSSSDLEWCHLGVVPPKGTDGFQFVTVGWVPGAPKPSSTYISNPDLRWWYALAKGDLDGDGQFSTFFLSSETNEVVTRP